VLGEEGIPQGDPKLKHWATSPFSFWYLERPKAEALGYLDAKAKARSSGNSKGKSTCIKGKGTCNGGNGNSNDNRDVRWNREIYISRRRAPAGKKRKG
jgi:hypothetical protein